MGKFESGCLTIHSIPGEVIMAEARASKSVPIPLTLLPWVLLVAVGWLIGPHSGWGQSANDPSRTRDQPLPEATPGSSIEFSCELPDGVKVEFVGLAKMSTDEKDAKSWWKPDGSPKRFAPAYWGGLTAGGEREYVRTIFHVHGINDTNAVTVTSAMSSNHQVVPAVGDPLIANYGVIDIFPPDKTTSTFVVGVATEPRSSIRFLDVNGKRLPPSADAPPDPIAEDITIETIGDVTFGVRQVDGQTTFITPGDRIDTDGTQVTYRIPSEWQKVDLQISAIDKEGNSYPGDVTVSLEPKEELRNTTRVVKLFSLPISEVDHFEYQFRLFRSWVTYEGVSLQPGKTDVKVSSRSIPKGTAATAPIKNVADPATNVALATGLGVPVSERKGIAVIGQIDIDSDGKSDRDRLHQKINVAGFVIGDEIDDDGNLLIQDSVNWPSTRFFVIGTFERFTDEKHRDRVIAQLTRMRNEARANGVRTIKLADFIAYIYRIRNTDEYANLLTSMMHEPSENLLTRLLKGTETKQPEIVKLIDNGYDSNGSPLKQVDTGTEQYVIVSALVQPLVNPTGRQIEKEALPQCAFIFDLEGRHVATIGGRVNKTDNYSPDRIDVLSLGPEEDWFVRITRFEKRPPFEYATEYHRIGESIVNSIRILHYANSSPWSRGPAPNTRYGTLYFDFPSVKDKFVSRETANTSKGVAVAPVILWNGDRNCFVGPAEQIAKGKLLYKVDRQWSGQFEDLSPGPDQIVVAGGTRQEGNWHSWHTVLQQNTEAMINITIPQKDGQTKQIQKLLKPGASYISLEIISGGVPGMHLYINDDREFFSLPADPDERLIPHPPIVQVLNPGNSITLFQQPLKYSEDEITMEVRLLNTK
jgi:hypothetical protein